MKNKKSFVLTIIAISFIALLIISASYAFFNLATNNFRTKKINAGIENMGTVALTTGSDLTLTLTNELMSDKGVDIEYFASSNGTTTTETTEAIAKAVVTGGGTFSCDYTISFDDNESSLYDVFQEASIVDLTLTEVDKSNQIVLTINDTSYDFATASLFPQTITGTLANITEDNPQFINAQLKVINKTGIKQTSLAGSSIELTFTVSDFTCTATN